MARSAEGVGQPASIRGPSQSELDAARLSLYDNSLAAERALLALDAGRMGSWRWDLVKGEITGDPNAAKLLRLDYDAQPWPEATGYGTIHPDDFNWVTARSMQALEKTDVYEAVFRSLTGTRPDGTQDYIWLGVRGRVTQRDADGKPLEMLGVNWDATAEKLMEERLKMMASEMDHRIRNAFAIVQALVNVGSRMAEDVPSFAATLREQVRAMADMHMLSARSARQEMGETRAVTVREVLEQSLKPWLGQDKPVGEGVTVTIDVVSDCLLPPGKVSTLGMLVYELTTNAMKYGALGLPGGRLAVRVEQRSDDRIEILWHETRPDGLRFATPPREAGFGRTLVDYCAQTPRGDLERDLSETGIRYRLVMPHPSDRTADGS